MEARILEGDGQTSRPGSHLPHALVIEVTDETGTRVPGALVSFQLPEDGASGRFRNGLRTEILKTGENGRVALPSLETGIIAGQFQIHMMAAKGDARAGVVSNQFIATGLKMAAAAGPATGAAAEVSTAVRTDPVKSRGGTHIGIWRPSRRVLEVGALVVIAAAVGYSKIGHSTVQTVETPPSIGTPTITIAK